MAPIRDVHPLHPDNVPGDRVKLVSTTDQFTKVRPGTVGTVVFIDSLETVHVRWDSGEVLGLVPGTDRWITTDVTGETG